MRSSDKRTIWVTGADGQLGRSLRRITEGSDCRYLFTDVAEVDITDCAAVDRFVNDHRVDVVINCAAYTQVNRAEKEEPAADRINREAVGYLARAAQRCGALLVHISTDYVFGGSGNLPYREEDPVAPLGAYGRTKRAGELEVIQSGCRYLILRTAWLYSEYGNNFVKTMLRLMSEQKQLKVVFDQVGTPTYAGDLARAIRSLVESEACDGEEGVYHFSNEGVCSWFDFACEIARMSGAAGTVFPCRSEEYPSDVVRPAYSVLDKTKFKRTFGQEIPYWRDSLRVCLDRLGVLKGRED